MTTGIEQCAIHGCRTPATALSLCRAHLALAAEWVEGEGGVADVLPGPCLSCGSRVGIRYAGGWICATCEWRWGEVPDDELSPPRVDVVYYIRFEGRMKIGTSSNPRRRLATLWHDELLAFERGGRALERRRHEQFAAQRLARTEWFEIDDELRTHVDTVRVDEPWALHARWLSEALALRG